MKVCKLCGHLKEDENHICPTAEYLRARDQLLELADMADVSEDIEEDVLRKAREV